MKKVFLILIMVIVECFTLLAPAIRECVIYLPEPIEKVYTVDDWMEAIVFIESGAKGSEAYNSDEPLAEGKFQQYPIFVDDVNRILGYEKYSYEDRKDDKKAEEMFWIYQKYYNPEMGFEKMCRIQCGGPDGYKYSSTIPYYNLVKNRLYS
jgi:hypothetical protein